MAGNAREFLDSEKCDSADVWINLATESHAAREEAAQIEAKRGAALKERQLFEAAWHAASEERENYEAKKCEAIEERENFEAKFRAFSLRRPGSAAQFWREAIWMARVMAWSNSAN